MPLHRLSSVFFLVLLAANFVSSETNGTTDEDELIVVRTSAGAVRGRLIRAYDDREGFAFLGIPFAESTDGDRRFRKPVKRKPWEGIVDCTVKKPACPAVGRLTYKRPEGGPMSEDCLHVYVYASRNCLRKGDCPVMAVVHGGRFNFESPVIFPDDVMVHNFASDGQDVVVVLLAFRLAAFGFLNIAPSLKTSTDKNMAIYDLVLGLEWIQEEIANFGGDPHKVTLFGHSGGAMIVDMLALTPKTKGLFHQLVLMSGVATQRFGLMNNDVNWQTSWKLAEVINCSTSDMDRHRPEVVEDVIGCLRAQPWETIVKGFELLNDYYEDFVGPTLDGPDGLFESADQSVVDERLVYPTLIGSVTAEFRDSKYIVADGFLDKGKLDELCRVLAYTLWFENREAMNRACFDFYKQDNRSIHMLEDVDFYYGNHLTARSLSRKGNPVYMYSYDYKGAGQAFNNFVKLASDEHPGHSEDYIYILGMHRANFTAKDYEIERIYAGMVRDFVVTGNPSPAGYRWKKWTKRMNQYFLIDFDDKMRMPGNKYFYSKRAVDYWDKLVDRIGGAYSIQPTRPKHVDLILANDIITVLNSHHMHKSDAHDKTLGAMEIGYQSYITYTEQRRAEYLGQAGAMLEEYREGNISEAELEKEEKQHRSRFWKPVAFIAFGMATPMFLFAFAFYRYLFPDDGYKKIEMED